MEKYNDLPMLIRSLMNLNKTDKDKFTEFKLSIASKDLEIKDLKEEISLAKKKIENNNTKLVTYSLAAATGGYVLGK